MKYLKLYEEIESKDDNSGKPRKIYNYNEFMVDTKDSKCTEENEEESDNSNDEIKLSPEEEENKKRIDYIKSNGEIVSHEGD